MSQTTEFTPEQIKAWRSYERVRRQGRHNMFEPRARVAARLSHAEYMFCMEHYAALKEAANAEP